MSIMMCDFCQEQKDSDFVEMDETLEGVMCEHCYCNITADKFNELFDDHGEPRKAELNKQQE